MFSDYLYGNYRGWFQYFGYMVFKRHFNFASFKASLIRTVYRTEWYAFRSSFSFISIKVKFNIIVDIFSFWWHFYEIEIAVEVIWIYIFNKNNILVKRFYFLTTYDDVRYCRSY